MELSMRGMRTRKEGSTIQQDSWIERAKSGPKGGGQDARSTNRQDSRFGPLQAGPKGETHGRVEHNSAGQLNSCQPSVASTFTGGFAVQPCYPAR